MPNDMTRGNGHKLKQEAPFEHQETLIFTVRVTEHRHRLPREVVDSPSLEILESHLHMVLGSLL